MSKKIFIIMITIIMILLLIIPNMVFADDITTGMGDIYKTPDSDFINVRAGKILGVVQTVGTGIAIIMLIVIGVKYMIASAQEKAQLKDTLMPYLIGAILLFAGTNILSIIVNFINEVK